MHQTAAGRAKLWNEIFEWLVLSHKKKTLVGSTIQNSSFKKLIYKPNFFTEPKPADTKNVQDSP